MSILHQPVPAIIGEAVAGESAVLRKQLESIVNSVDKSTFDIGELLYKVKKHGYYQQWGFSTFYEYVATFKNFKRSKAEYLVRIVERMTASGVERSAYEKLQMSKLRVISYLDPDDTWKNPETGVEIPLKEFIVGFVEKGADMSLEELETHVRTLKGQTGENDLTWLNVRLLRTALDNTVRPALELAKNAIGTVGKDDEGMAKDASDGAALETIAVEFLNNPANNVLPEDAG